MTSPPETPNPHSNARVIWGAIVSAAYVATFFIYAVVQDHAMLAMKPNELADFLAGVSAPLAFLWLVLGYFQQGEELRNSSDALRLQEEELHDLVGQQSEMVSVAREQFEHERLRAEVAEKEARRLAQPTLIMKGGMSRTSAEKPNTLIKSFTLQNVGTTCTQVRVNFDGLRTTQRIASLSNGDRREFDLEFDLPTIDRKLITITYVDGRGEEGKTSFWLQKKGDNVSVAHKPFASESESTN